MRKTEREDPDQGDGSVKPFDLVIEIMPDGTVLLPRNADAPFLIEIAKVLGDKKAQLFCEQAAMSNVHIGKRMCG